jgi:hypothetical protein
MSRSGESRVSAGNEDAVSAAHERERVGVAVRVDADDDVERVCNHLLYLQHMGGLDPVSVWSVEAARGRTVRSHARKGRTGF